MIRRKKIMDLIGFLKWAELGKDIMDKLRVGIDVGLKRTFISPDVKSLWVVWDDGEDIAYELIDYNDCDGYETLMDLFYGEVMDDAYETYEGQSGNIMDYIDNDDTIKVLSLQDIGEV